MCVRACVRACVQTASWTLIPRSAGSASPCAYRCARHWLVRNDREVGQPLECLACCVASLSTEPLSLLSRAQRFFHWNSNAPNALFWFSFSLFFFHESILFCAQLLLPLIVLIYDLEGKLSLGSQYNQLILILYIICNRLRLICLNREHWCAI